MTDEERKAWRLRFAENLIGFNFADHAVENASNVFERLLGEYDERTPVPAATMRELAETRAALGDARKALDTATESAAALMLMNERTSSELKTIQGALGRHYEASPYDGATAARVRDIVGRYESLCISTSRSEAYQKDLAFTFDRISRVTGISTNAQCFGDTFAKAWEELHAIGKRAHERAEAAEARVRELEANESKRAAAATKPEVGERIVIVGTPLEEESMTPVTFSTMKPPTVREGEWARVLTKNKHVIARVLELGSTNAVVIDVFGAVFGCTAEALTKWRPEPGDRVCCSGYFNEGEVEKIRDDDLVMVDWGAGRGGAVHEARDLRPCTKFRPEQRMPVKA